MNLVFSFLLILSLIMAIISSPNIVISSALSGAKSGIFLCVELMAIYAIWMSIFDIMEKIGMTHFIDKIFRPITRKLFKGEDAETLSLISNNFSANLLGMGSVATPLGIRAMEKMNGDKSTASDNALLFMVINATSIQLLPTTIISMRSEAGSIDPSSIVLPSLIATSIATIVGIILSKILARHHD